MANRVSIDCSEKIDRDLVIGWNLFDNHFAEHESNCEIRAGVFVHVKLAHRLSGALQEDRNSLFAVPERWRPNVSDKETDGKGITAMVRSSDDAVAVRQHCELVNWKFVGTQTGNGKRETGMAGAKTKARSSLMLFTTPSHAGRVPSAIWRKSECE
jgi:hypothetical protein